MKTYHIWWQRHGSDEWTQTAHIVKARSDKEAQSRVKRKFARSGFAGMSLLAVVEGMAP